MKNLTLTPLKDIVLTPPDDRTPTADEIESALDQTLADSDLMDVICNDSIMLARFKILMKDEIRSNVATVMKRNDEKKEEDRFFRDNDEDKNWIDPDLFVGEGSEF
jgi:hypothetical protein